MSPPGAPAERARRAPGLTTHLVAFALALLLPTLGLGAVVALQALQNYRAVFQDRLQDTARGLALALDAEIGRYRGAVEALAGSGTLDGLTPDLARFELEARRTAAMLGTSVILLESGGMRQLVNTALPRGAPAGGITAADFRTVAETRRPVVSDVVPGAVAQRPVVGVAVPVERGDDVPYVLAARIEPERLAALLAAQALGPGEFATLRDGHDVVVARSAEHAAYVGRKVPAWFGTATEGRDSGIVIGPAIDGAPALFGFHRLRTAPSWTVVVAAPTAGYRASWLGPLRDLGIGGGVALLLGTGLALLLARRLVRPVTALARQAEQVAASGGRSAGDAALQPAGVREIDLLQHSVAQAQLALTRQAAAEHEALTALQESERRLRLVVAELNHRAKNALATVQALAQQTMRGPAGADPARFTEVFTARLQTLARAHDLLAALSWEGAALEAVVQAGLAPWLEAAGGAGEPRFVLRCRCGTAVPPASPGQVQALVMALHELATNATKYGALSVPGGKVEVACRAEAEGRRAVLEWRESGGPPLAGPPTERGFGTRLLERALARDLGPGARVALDFAPEGLRATIAFAPQAALGAASDAQA